jgi:hypothetical protein
VDADLILCDHAEALNGKLYVMGGGWNMLTVAEGQPLQIALGIIVKVPWDQTNVAHNILVELLTADGDTVEIDGQPVAPSGQFELGRPAGVKQGSTLNMPVAFNIQGFMVDAGQYEWRLSIDGNPIARAPFAVVEPS